MNASERLRLPIVTCIVPCFNESVDVLRLSLNSLIGQSFKNFECFVIDESTKEKTSEECRKICQSDSRFFYINPERRLGLAGSLNIGLKRANGKFIARFDSDDICKVDRLSLQVKFFDDHPDIDVLGGAMEIIDSTGRITGCRDYPLEHMSIEKKFAFTNAMAHPTIMFRKSILEGLKGYDSSFRYSEDLELWLRSLNQGFKFANLPNVLISYRQQTSSRLKENWSFNLRARTKNLSSRYFFRKALGILLIGGWSFFPTNLQQPLFKLLNIRKFNSNDK